jgi:hypothetical protein
MSAAELLAFYRARLDEDEAAARALPEPPARALREVEAKRAIANAWEHAEAARPRPGGQVYGYQATGLLIAIKHLVWAWSDHPDYRLDWRA